VVERNGAAEQPLPGIPGVEIRAGDHICALYRERHERHDVLMPFLREGLSLGHKCLVGLYEQDTGPILDAIGDDLNVGEAVTTGQLEVLGGGGRGALRVRPPDRRVHLVGPAASRLRGARELRGGAQRVAARNPVGFLCMYDMSEITGSVVVDLLRTLPGSCSAGSSCRTPTTSPFPRRAGERSRDAGRYWPMSCHTRVARWRLSRLSTSPRSWPESSRIRRRR
jgi:hypothetical protein